MKKLSIALFAVSILFSSCSKGDKGTHTHEDGSTHADHTDTTQQESFDASDTTHHEHDSASHDHPHPH
jgi:major membrane immunogen (membrane-anchored lipoprotein)